MENRTNNFLSKN